MVSVKLTFLCLHIHLCSLPSLETLPTFALSFQGMGISVSLVYLELRVYHSHQPSGGVR